MTGTIRVRAPGKVNLALSVGPLRADGYHDLATVFHAVSLYDEIEVAEGAGLQVMVSGEGADLVEPGPANLAHRALALLAERAGIRPDVHAILVKAIPVAAGMAGGSADAAAALAAGAALWRTRAEIDLTSLAADLGSDVPFALRGGTAVGTGRGERLTPVLCRGEFHWVLALSRTTLSTPAVYAELDRLRGDRGEERRRRLDVVVADGGRARRQRDERRGPYLVQAHCLVVPVVSVRAERTFPAQRASGLNAAPRRVHRCCCNAT